MRRFGGDGNETATRGVVFIEFIIAFVPVFLLFLGIVQLALLSAARQVVQHAAVTGVRSAIVVLDDDPRFYDNAERGSIVGERDTPDLSFERTLASRLGLTNDPSSDTTPALGEPRMAAIRRAVHAPLAAIAPEPWLAARLLQASAAASVEQALGTTPGARFLFGFGFYLPMATAITFPVAPGSSQPLEGTLPLADRVTLRVTHHVLCVIPVVAGFMCDRLRWDLRRNRLTADRAPGDPIEDALRELRRAPAAARQQALAWAGIPALVLQAEATLPSQSAAYSYESERKEK